MLAEVAPRAVAGTLGALAVGVGGSGHCALMCGPLACGPVSLAPPGARRRAAIAWQAGRLGAYAVVGTLAGGVGAGAARALGAAGPALSWAMAGALALTAVDVGKLAPALPGVRGLARRLGRLGARFSPTGRAAAMGAITPLLPCGLLYGVLLAAMATGSVGGGALVMTAFALATSPALALVQWNARALQRHPRALRVLRTAVPLVAAAVLVWRALAGGGAEPPRCH
jgi:sulfite exporter TauE/SafE